MHGASFFRLGPTGDKSSADQSCDGAEDRGSPTRGGWACRAPAADSDPEFDAALAGATAWLLDTQGTTAPSAATPSPEPNANSTGSRRLLAERGETAPPRPRRWVPAAGRAVPRTALRDAGAVASDPRAAGRHARRHRRRQRDLSAAPPPRRRSAYPAPPEASRLERPQGYQHTGYPVDLTWTGVSAERQLCVTQPNGVRRTVGAGASGARTWLGTQAGRQTIAVAGLGASDEVTVPALSGTELDVVAFRGEQGNVVVVQGLAPYEEATVRARGGVVARGFAGKNGNFVRGIEVGGPPTAAVAGVRGAFGDRSGFSGFRVAR